MLTDYRQASLSYLRHLHRAILIAAALLAGGTLLNRFVATPLRYEGTGMEASLRPGQFILVNRLGSLLRKPSIGTLVAIRTSTGSLLVKRVSGLPEQTVIEENVPVTLGINQYFVVSDSPSQSIDSRQIGPVGQDRIVGTVVPLF